MPIAESRDIVTLDILKKALQRVSPQTDEEAEETATAILETFGYQDAVPDNHITVEQRNLFYMLEGTVLKTSREESDAWFARKIKSLKNKKKTYRELVRTEGLRIHYWALNKEFIFNEIPATEAPKKVAASWSYFDLDDSVWHDRSLKVPELDVLNPLAKARKNILEKFTGRLTLDDLMFLDGSELTPNISTIAELGGLCKKIGEKRGESGLRGQQKRDFIIKAIRERPNIDSITINYLFKFNWQTSFRYWNDARRAAGARVKVWQKTFTPPDKETGRRIILDYIKNKFLAFRDKTDRKPRERAVYRRDIRQQFKTHNETYDLRFTEAKILALAELIKTDMAENPRITQSEIVRRYGINLWMAHMDFYGIKAEVLGRPFGMKLFKNKEQVAEEATKYLLGQFKAADDLVLRCLYQSDVAVSRNRKIPAWWFARFSESAYNYGVEQKDMGKFVKADGDSINRHLGTMLQDWGLNLSQIKFEVSKHVPGMRRGSEWLSYGDLEKQICNIIGQKQPALISEIHEDLCSIIEKTGKVLTEDAAKRIFANIAGTLARLEKEKAINFVETIADNGHHCKLYFTSAADAAQKKADELMLKNSVKVNGRTIALGSTTLIHQVYCAVAQSNQQGKSPCLKDIVAYVSGQIKSCPEAEGRPPKSLYDTVRGALSQLVTNGLLATEKVRPAGYRQPINRYSINTGIKI